MADRRLELGVVIPNTASYPLDPGLTAMAVAAESAGADGLWVNDHILMVEDTKTPYPYSADGKPWWPLDMPWYEAIVCCAHLAAVTTKCRVGTCVLILPQRNVLELAKMTATIDRLSAGRLVLGIGLGWLAEESEVLGYRFATRGLRGDEMIQVLRDCWTGRTAGFAGKELNIPSGLIFEPGPARAGGPPILVGGMSRAALRRAGTLGDGWIARGQPTGIDVDALRAAITDVNRYRAEAGREGNAKNILMVAKPLPPRNRLKFLVDQSIAAGFDEFLFEPPWSQLETAVDCIALLRDHIGPRRSAMTVSEGGAHAG